METVIPTAAHPRQAGNRQMVSAVIAGREGYLAGRMAKRMYADRSSPLAGLI